MAANQVTPLAAVILFDVFGTVVDWHSGLAREAQTVFDQRGWRLDAAAFARDWRRAYSESMRAVRDGEQPWADMDTLNAASARRLLRVAGLDPTDADISTLVTAWRRLDPWPDSVAGMHRLAQRYSLTALSNGSVALLTDLARHAGLPFVHILGSDLFRVYKPDPEIYLGALRTLGATSAESLMVAAHNYDLVAAASHGIGTAFVRRPLEWAGHERAEEPAAQFDFVVDSLVDLAQHLGC